MKRNVGNTDKIVRWILSLIFVVLYFTNIVTGTLGIVLLIVAAVLIITTFINFCPLYLPFGINTFKKKE